MARQIIDVTGQKFNRLTVLEMVKDTEHKCIRWICKCDCGNETLVLSRNLRSGATKSCGCMLRERSTVGGLSNTRLYGIWTKMVYRCTQNSENYKNYSGRGISVCNEWLNDFKAFYDWSMSHGYADNLSIERINNDDGYHPDNCCWADMKTQNNNTRRNHYLTYKDKTQTMAQWAEEYRISYTTLRARINIMKWDIEKALNMPIRHRCKISNNSNKKYKL